MPFALPTRPSIQIGLLKAIAESHGFAATTLHLNLDFAARLGLDEYAAVSLVRRPQLGEWLFSAAAFRGDVPATGRFLEELEPQLPEVLAQLDAPRAWLEHARSVEVPAFLDEVMRENDWSRFEVVGFSTTFQQNTASFALARRIKEEHPQVTVVFGGANFDGEMGAEWMRSVPWIDHAVSGEADLAFPALLGELCDDGDPSLVPGVLTRTAAGAVVTRRGDPVEDLDALPVPDYAEFFERAERIGFLEASNARAVDIPFESARGCWWGERRHCTFCGLNGATMQYRSKRPARLPEELTELAHRHGSFQMEAVDNILDMNYFDELLEPLTRAGADFRFFYEVKANLGRADLKRLFEGGVRRIQPGIESLSSHVLALMNKGTRAAQNVNFLRWSAYYGISVGWNLLYGFPGETQADYDEQVATIPRLVHLEPPLWTGRISIDRFSPIFEDRDRFAARWIRPHPSYASIYPAAVDLDRAAYHFEADFVETLPQSAYEDTSAAVASWQAQWNTAEKPRLTARWAPGLLQIEDTRDRANLGTYSFRDPLASIYRACSQGPGTVAKVRSRLELAQAPDEIEDILDGFCDRGLMMRDGNLFLALALPATSGR